MTGDENCRTGNLTCHGSTSCSLEYAGFRCPQISLASARNINTWHMSTQALVLTCEAVHYASNHIWHSALFCFNIDYTCSQSSPPDLIQGIDQNMSLGWTMLTWRNLNLLGWYLTEHSHADWVCKGIVRQSQHESQIFDAWSKDWESHVCVM